MALSLSVIDPTDADARASLDTVAAAAASVDGYRPFNEQSLLDLAAGRRTGLLLCDSETTQVVVGAAIVGAGELDLVVAPEARRSGCAAAALPGLLAMFPHDRDITAWSHGDHPGARALGPRFGFSAERTLFELQLSPLPPADDAAAGNDSSRGGTSDRVTIDAFRPGADDEAWVALNALVFAHHPEQGGLTRADLVARMAEPWFNADDFLIARDADGRMVGYNWLKITHEKAGLVGEIYVVGIHPDASGRGLGRRLMRAGLSRLAERECTAAVLYVDEDNPGAVHLYRSLGFTERTVDVQYRRRAA